MRCILHFQWATHPANVIELHIRREVVVLLLLRRKVGP